MFRKVRRLAKQLYDGCYNAIFNPVCGYVIMLHRIGPIEPERLDVIEELKVSEERLQRFVDAKRKQYDFISLDELYRRMKGESVNRRPFICFTFDDGFKDNLTIGLPFFEKNRIPFAVFVTTDFINRRPAFNYPFLLENIVRHNESIKIGEDSYFCKSQEEKKRTFLQLKEMVLRLPYEGFEISFNSLFRDYLRPEYYEDLMMTWDDVRILAESPLCTLGSHTVSHCRLSMASNQGLVDELVESKKQIEQIVNNRIEYISYPFGWHTDVNDFVIHSTREAGYTMGFISHGGAVRKKDTDYFRIKRLMLKEN